MVKQVGIFLIGLGIALLLTGLALEFGSENQETGLAISPVVKTQLSVLDYSEALLFSLAIMSLLMGTLFLSKSRQ